MDQIVIYRGPHAAVLAPGGIPCARDHAVRLHADVADALVASGEWEPTRHETPLAYIADIQAHVFPLPELGELNAPAARPRRARTRPARQKPSTGTAAKTPRSNRP